MKSHIHILSSNILSIVPGIIFTVSLSFAASAYADQNATISAVGTFTDVISGIEFLLDLEADENTAADVGHVKYTLYGASGYGSTPHAIRSCSTTGGGNTEPGTHPAAGIQCGSNGRQAVSINNCKANIETHAHVHSDVPFVTYVGSTTTAIAFKRTGGNWIVSVSMYTPKSKIILQGPFTPIHPTLSGQISISNCP